MSELSSDGPYQTVRYALVRAAGSILAVPTADIVEALPLDATAAHLPRLERSLLGVMVHRGQVIPVVDLAYWGSLQHREPGEGCTQVLILQKGDRLTGIAIECTMGIAAGNAILHEVHHQRTAEELFHSVLACAECEGPVPVLETDHLLQQTQVWVKASPGIRQTLQSPPMEQHHKKDSFKVGEISHTQPQVVVALGGLRLGLPVQAVGTLMRRPSLQTLPRLVPGLEGLFEWRQRNVPVVRIHQALGTKAPLKDSPLEDWLLVIHTESAALGILVDDFIAVQKFESGALQPAGDALLSNVTLDSGSGMRNATRLLYPTALLNAFPISAIGTKPISGAIKAHESPAPQAHLILQAGRVMAIALHEVQEIVLFDQDDISVPRSMHFQWRGQMLPLMDLRFALAKRPSTAGLDHRVLIVKMGDLLKAVLVEAVLNLVPALAGTTASVVLNKGRRVNMLTTVVDGKPQSYEIVALAALGGSHHG